MGRDPDGHYACLGVSPEASLSEIRAAFRAKAKGPRPGAAPDDAIPRRLHEAYGVLSDSDRRASYDARGFRPDGWPRPAGALSVPCTRRWIARTGRVAASASAFVPKPIAVRTRAVRSRRG